MYNTVMPEESFIIEQESFEGPLDLLLSLIEKRKLHISDISLAKVADDYIAHIQQCENVPVAESAQFLLIASTLTLIKSKSLLPKLELTQEEEQDVSDLETRLKQYQHIQALSSHVRTLYGARPMHQGGYEPEITPVFTPGNDMTNANLVTALQRVMSQLPVPEKMAKAVVQKVISLEEMIDKLSARITNSLKMNFSEFSGNSGALNREQKVHVVVSFLAMLELVKNGAIMVKQQGQFDDIEIETQNVGIPKY